MYGLRYSLLLLLVMIFFLQIDMWNTFFGNVKMADNVKSLNYVTVVLLLRFTEDETKLNGSNFYCQGF